MEINVDELNSFFDNHTSVAMPQTVISGAILRGVQFKKGELEAQVIEWSTLKQFAPIIAAKISPPTLGYNIPLLRLVKRPEHYAYHPQTGEYLGEFRINPTSIQKKPTEF